MSDKPHDIPQDVWIESGMKFDQLYDAEPDLEGGHEFAIRCMACRMVMAERERCVESVREALGYAGYSTDAGHGRAVINAILAGARP